MIEKKKPTKPDAKRTLRPDELVLWPEAQAAATIEAWKHFGEVDTSALIPKLSERTARIAKGDMQPVEAMLIGQANTLQHLFTGLSRKAAHAEYLSQVQAFMGLALKAQAQCRATLEALAEIKNPRPVAFVRQANIAQGPQQVNNGQAPRAEKTPIAPNGLLETPHERMDIRPKIEPSRADPALEAVGAVHRATHD